jgi:[ribosomal protein S5]-alanine N-acetyltransferase
MPMLESIQLQTPRLSLRPLKLGDAENLLSMHADRENMQFSNGLPWTAIEQAHDLIQSSKAWLVSGRHLCLGIASRETDEVFGTCTLFDIDSGSRRGELGFILSSQQRNKGYMTEALRALLLHAFDGLNLNRVEADTDPMNAQAIKLLEALGFQREGLLRERWIVGNLKSDSAFYGLLRGDWLRKQEFSPRGVA